jgi:anti-sigma-K factor RskA
MSGTIPQTDRDMSCDEVAELAGLYVLDALEPGEAASIRAHLATCAEAHDEMRELGGVVSALASSVEPLDAPPALKARVLAAVKSEAAAARSATRSATRSAEVEPWTLAAPPRVTAPASRRWSPPAWAAWGTAVAALLIVAVVGVSAMGALSRADRAEQRSQVLAEAIAAFSAPGASTAVLRGSGAQEGASGFAAFSADGKGYLVMVGLPSAPQGRDYQAWYIVGGQAASAGLIKVDDDGYAVLVNPSPLSGTEVVALTLEPAGGSDQPTTQPFAAADVHTSA